MSRTAVIYCLSVVLLSVAVGAVVWYLPSRSDSVSTDPEKTALAVGPLPAGAAAPLSLPPGVHINFVDVTKKAGIRFAHVDGRTDMQYLMDSTGSGVAWIDFDQDGLLDLFLVQGNA